MTMTTTRTRPMETIPETSPNPQSPISPGGGRAVEALLLYTIPTTQQQEEEQEREPKRQKPKLPRSSKSLGAKTVKNTSARVREWVKRSQSSRTPSRHPTVGGLEIRVLTPAAQTQLETTTTQLIPLAEISKRHRPDETGPASSIDSRVTQWFDIYPEDHHKTPTSSKGSPAHDINTKGSPPAVSHSKENEEDSLRPAPLRLSPRAEKAAAEKEKAAARRQGHVRADSKWKALPMLPAQVDGVADGTKTNKNRDGEKNREGERRIVDEKLKKDTTNPPTTTATTSPHSNPTLPPLTPSTSTSTSTTPLKDPSPPPSTIDGSPPPTPDSSKAGKARTRKPVADRNITHKASKDREPARMNREERAWLHANYRGEAPFLRAWGLDISLTQDRQEGVGILRELMAAERERKLSSSTVGNGSL